MKRILIFLLLLLCCAPLSSQASILELDLNDRTDLNNDWTFYKDQLMIEPSVQLEGKEVSLPHFWTRAPIGREGYGTYTKTIILNEEAC